MSEEKKSTNFDKKDNNDLTSNSDNLDLNSFVKKTKEKEPKNFLEKVMLKAKKFLKKIKKNRKKKGKKSVWQTILTTALVFMIIFSIALASFVIYIFAFIDDEVQENLHDLQLNFTTTIYGYDSATGKYVEYQRVHGSENRIWVSFDKMPQNLKDAFVSIEDERFYAHNGVDWKRTLGAFVNMFVDIYSSNQGGSTITQQLVKNLTGDNDQNVMRKIREIMRARYLENNYDKDVILECYLNTASFSNGICGVEVASNYYFNKSVSDLNLAECAALAAIVKNPERYRPDRNPQYNAERRELVLGKMLELGKITQAEHDAALKADVKIVADSSHLKEKEINSYFVDALIDEVVDDLVEQKNMDRSHAEINFYNGGYKIYSTVDAKIQGIVDKNFSDPKWISTSKDGQTAQASFTIMDYNGNVLGIAGGLGEKTANRALNRATTTLRPPGSTMKPIGAYAPALENNLITYSSYYIDEPIEVKNWETGEMEKWPPNWYKGYEGKKTIFSAIERSVNTIPVKLVQQMGFDKPFDFLVNNFGLTTLERDSSKDLTYSNLALGGSYKGVTNLELTAAYATFGNLGYYNLPRLYTKVTTQRDEPVLQTTQKTKIAMSEETAFIMNKLLLYPVYGSRGTGKEVRPYIKNTKIFAKTGTTNWQNDLWFVGGSPYYVAGCWYGYDTPAVVSDNKLALRLWGSIMQEIHEDLPAKEFPVSSKVEIHYYCEETGLVANSTCPIVEGHTGYYKKNYLPPCTVHGGNIKEPVTSKSDINTPISSTSSTTSSTTSGSTSSGGTSNVTSNNSSTNVTTSAPTTSQ